jgi:hypothetical protein
MHNQPQQHEYRRQRDSDNRDSLHDVVYPEMGAGPQSLICPSRAGSPTTQNSTAHACGPYLEEGGGLGLRVPDGAENRLLHRGIRPVRSGGFL